MAKRVPGPHRCPFPRGRPSKRCPFYPVLKHPKGFIWAMFRTPSKTFPCLITIYLSNVRAEKRLFPPAYPLSKDLQGHEIALGFVLLIRCHLECVIGEGYTSIGLPKRDNVPWESNMVSSFISSPKIQGRP